MSINKIEKVFTDPKEEITFLLDKIRTIKDEKLILVVPSNSAIFVNPVTLKIFYRVITRLEKRFILVTEDLYGVKYAQSVGIIVVSKLSQITTELWDVVETRWRNYLDNLIDRDQSGLVEMQRNEELNSIENNLQESNKVVYENENSEILTDLPKNDIQPEQKQNSDTFIKKRTAPILLNLNGIEIYGGGDIRSLKNVPKNDKIDDNEDFNEDLMENKRRLPSSSSSGNFLGRDFTKQVSGSSSFFSWNPFGFLTRRRVSSGTGSELDELQLRKRRNIIIFVVTAVLAFAILGGLAVLVQSSSVDVLVKFETEDVNADTNVLVSLDKTEIVLDPLTIPAKEISVEKVSISRTGAADGEGVTGNKSKGFVRIYNLTSNTVDLPAGTKLTSQSTAREYVLIAAVKLNPAQQQGATLEAFYIDDVNVEAIAVGTEYNVALGDPSTTLNIEGYPGVDKVYASRTSAFEGGTIEKFKTASQANVDALKEAAKKDLETQAQNRIRAQLVSGQTLLPETITYTETAFTVTPKQGEKVGQDGSFSISIEMSASALVISNDDLEDIAEKVISKNKNSTSGGQIGSEVVVGDLDTPIINAVVKDSASGQYIISLSAKGTVGKRLNAEEIKEMIYGKDLRDLDTFLLELDGRQSHRFSFTPNILPDFLKRVPNDANRVKVRVE